MGVAFVKESDTDFHGRSPSRSTVRLLRAIYSKTWQCRYGFGSCRNSLQLDVDHGCRQAQQTKGYVKNPLFVSPPRGESIQHVARAPRRSLKKGQFLNWDSYRFRLAALPALCSPSPSLFLSASPSGDCCRLCCGPAAASPSLGQFLVRTGKARSSSRPCKADDRSARSLSRDRNG